VGSGTVPLSGKETTHMTKLTDIQAILLTLGAQRDDGSLLPPPDTLQNKTSPVRKAIGQLIKRTFAAEVQVTDAAKAWREEGDLRFGAIITEAGKQAIGISEQPSPNATGDGPKPSDDANGEGPAVEPQTAPRPASKQGMVLQMLERKEGASLDELVEATGWLPHTTRAALTGIRKRGVTFDKFKVDGVTRYRAPTGAAA
jgi:hypothetical protein